LLGGDAKREKIDPVSVTVVALTVAHIGEPERVSLTGEEKKRAKSALMSRRKANSHDRS